MTIDEANCVWIAYPEDQEILCPNPDDVVAGHCDTLPGDPPGCMGGTTKAALRCCPAPGLAEDTNLGCYNIPTLEGAPRLSCLESDLAHYGLAVGACWSSSQSCSGEENEVAHSPCSF